MLPDATYFLLKQFSAYGLYGNIILWLLKVTHFLNLIEITDQLESMTYLQNTAPNTVTTEDILKLDDTIVTGNPLDFPPLTPPPPVALNNSGGSGITQERSHKNLHTEHAQGQADYTYPFSDNKDIIFYLLRADQDGPSIGGTTNFTRFSDAGPANKEYPLSFLETDNIETGPYLPSDVQSFENETALAAATGLTNGTTGLAPSNSTTANLTNPSNSSPFSISPNLTNSFTSAPPFLSNPPITLADGTLDLTPTETFQSALPLSDITDLELPGGLRQVYLPVGPVSPLEAQQNTNRLIDALASINPADGLKGAAQTVLKATHGDNPLISTLIDKAVSFDSQAQFDPLDPIQVITSLTEVLLDSNQESNSINLLIETLTNSDPSKPIAMSLNIVKALSGVIQFYHNKEQVNPQQGAKTLVQTTTGYDLSNPNHINRATTQETEPVDTQTIYWTNLLNDLNLKNPASIVKTLIKSTQRYTVAPP